MAPANLVFTRGEPTNDVLTRSDNAGCLHSLLGFACNQMEQSRARTITSCDSPASESEQGK